MKKIILDADTYIPLHNDPTGKYKKELEKVIEMGFNDHLIIKKERAYLVPMAPGFRLFTFYQKFIKIWLIHQVGLLSAGWIL